MTIRNTFNGCMISPPGNLYKNFSGTKCVEQYDTLDCMLTCQYDKYGNLVTRTQSGTRDACTQPDCKYDTRKLYNNIKWSCYGIWSKEAEEKTPIAYLVNKLTEIYSSEVQKKLYTLGILYRNDKNNFDIQIGITGTTKDFDWKDNKHEAIVEINSKSKYALNNTSHRELVEETGISDYETIDTTYRKISKQLWIQKLIVIWERIQKPMKIQTIDGFNESVSGVQSGRNDRRYKSAVLVVGSKDVLIDTMKHIFVVNHTSGEYNKSLKKDNITAICCIPITVVIDVCKKMKLKQTESCKHQIMSLTEQMQLVEYSEKSCAVFGNTREYKEDMKALGGKFNMKLVRRSTVHHDNGKDVVGESEKTEPGWIFPKTSMQNIQSYLRTGTVSNPVHKQKSTIYQKSDELEELRKRIEVLETQVQELTGEKSVNSKLLNASNMGSSGAGSSGAGSSGAPELEQQDEAPRRRLLRPVKATNGQ